MILREALEKHELDVAAFELAQPQEQYDNLKGWLSKVEGSENEKKALLVGFVKRYRVRDDGDAK